MLLTIGPNTAVSRNIATISTKGRPSPTMLVMTEAIWSAAPLVRIAVVSGMSPPMRTTVCHETDR